MNSFSDCKIEGANGKRLPIAIALAEWRKRQLTGITSHSAA